MAAVNVIFHSRRNVCPDWPALAHCPSDGLRGDIRLTAVEKADTGAVFVRQIPDLIP